VKQGPVDGQISFLQLLNRTVDDGSFPVAWEFELKIKNRIIMGSTEKEWEELATNPETNAKIVAEIKQ
jgi:hypothetical protein